MVHSQVELFHMQLTDEQHCLRRVTVHRAQADLFVFSKTAVSVWHDITSVLPQQYTLHRAACIHSFLPVCFYVLINSNAELQYYMHLPALISPHVLACQGRNFGEDGGKLRTFKLFRRLYKYSPGQGIFQPVQAMPPHLPSQISRALESLRLINTAGMLSQSSYLS